MDPVWGCEWCQEGEGTCDCTEPCGAEQCEISPEYSTTEEEFDRMMKEAEDE